MASSAQAELSFPALLGQWGSTNAAPTDSDDAAESQAGKLAGGLGIMSRDARIGLAAAILFVAAVGSVVVYKGRTDRTWQFDDFLAQAVDTAASSEASGASPEIVAPPVSGSTPPAGQQSPGPPSSPVSPPATAPDQQKKTGPETSIAPPKPVLSPAPQLSKQSENGTPPIQQTVLKPPAPPESPTKAIPSPADAKLLAVPPPPAVGAAPPKLDASSLPLLPRANEAAAIPNPKVETPGPKPAPLPSSASTKPSPASLTMPTDDATLTLPAPALENSVGPGRSPGLAPKPSISELVTAPAAKPRTTIETIAPAAGLPTTKSEPPAPLSSKPGDLEPLNPPLRKETASGLTGLLPAQGGQGLSERKPSGDVTNAKPALVEPVTRPGAPALPKPTEGAPTTQALVPPIEPMRSPASAVDKPNSRTIASTPAPKSIAASTPEPLAPAKQPETRLPVQSFAVDRSPVAKSVAAAPLSRITDPQPSRQPLISEGLAQLTPGTGEPRVLAKAVPITEKNTEPRPVAAKTQGDAAPRAASQPIAIGKPVPESNPSFADASGLAPEERFDGPRSPEDRFAVVPQGSGRTEFLRVPSAEGLSGPRPAVVSYQVQRYVALEGDSFDTVAATMYGSAQLGALLHRYNRSEGRSSDRLKTGAAIRVPPRSLLESGAPIRETVATNSVGVDVRKPTDLIPRAEAEARSIAARGEPWSPQAPPVAVIAQGSIPKAPTGDAKSPSPAAGPSLTTTSDQTLWSISKRTLGDGGRFREIFDLNRDKLTDVNNLVPAGTVLRLPQDAKL